MSWLPRLKALAIFFFSIAILYFLFFSNFLTIKYVEITGLDQMPRAGIEESVWQQAANKRFILGSQKNILLFSKAGLNDALNNKYGFKNLIIKKQLPSTIKIILEELKYSAVWQDNGKYSYIDDQGDLILEVNLANIDRTKYPVIDNGGGYEINGDKVGDGRLISSAIYLFNDFTQKRKIFEIDRFIAGPEQNTLKIQTKDGPIIIFSSNSDLEKQITKLIVLMNEKLRDGFKKLSYIDLRYGDKVYYK